MSESLYEALGGAEAVPRLVDRFYQVMDESPAAAAIRVLHPADLGDSREKLRLFLSGWMGGPPLHVQRHGHPRLRTRHLPFPIGRRERDQWLACMREALAEVTSDVALAEELMRAFVQVADFLRNVDEGEED